MRSAVQVHQWTVSHLLLLQPTLAPLEQASLVTHKSNAAHVAFEGTVIVMRSTKQTANRRPAMIQLGLPTRLVSLRSCNTRAAACCPTQTRLLRPCRPRQYRSPPFRCFSTSPPRFNPLSSTLDTTHALLTSLHVSTQLPWVVTLPLTALLIRLALILPLTLYTRRSQITQLSLQPLILSWQHHIRRSTISTSHALGPAECTSIANATLRKKRMSIYAQHGCPWWKNYLPLMQLPVFLVVIETIRRMCGTHSGLLGLITTNPFSSTGDVDTPREDLLLALSSPASYVEPTMATEGALWFPNLLLPDPHLILPFLLSATLYLNIHMTAHRPRGSPAATTFQRRLTKTLKIVALAIGPATLSVPAGMLVYWWSSAMWALGTGRLVDHLMPLRIPPTKLSTDAPVDEKQAVEELRRLLKQPPKTASQAASTRRIGPLDRRRSTQMIASKPT